MSTTAFPWHFLLGRSSCHFGPVIVFRGAVHVIYLHVSVVVFDGHFSFCDVVFFWPGLGSFLPFVNEPSRGRFVTKSERRLAWIFSACAGSKMAVISWTSASRSWPISIKPCCILPPGSPRRCGWFAACFSFDSKSVSKEIHSLEKLQSVFNGLMMFVTYKSEVVVVRPLQNHVF